MKYEPKLSVVMPCYNHSRYLSESIEGVLSQAHSNLELIIIDDSSDDNSIDIIEKYMNIDTRIKYIHHSSNMGVSKSRNDAISLANGDYIAFCDADDVWEKNKIEVQLNCLEQQVDYNVVYCDSIIINENSIPTGDKFSELYNKNKYHGNIFNELCITNFINTPSVLVRGKCIKNNIYFNEGFRYLEDWIYMLRLASEYKFYYIDKPLVRYRVHTKSTNKDKYGYMEHRVKSYKHIVENYPNITRAVLSNIYYNVGVNYIGLGDTHNGKSYLIKSARANILNYRSVLRLMWILLKI